MNEFISACLTVGFVTGGVAAFFTALAYTINNGTPQDNYRKSFDRTLECREKVKTPTDIDAICGKIPQWSEFVKESK
jgi:hypothetical protein